MSDQAVGTSAAEPQDVQTEVPAASDVDSEEIPESFTCCVCLDLLYKPVLLSCGHMSCFWCVHKSMSGLRESKCPICRHPYIHFPSICPMLHFMLLKMHPITYMRREKQMREEETKIRISSPQLDAQLWSSLRNECLSDASKVTTLVDSFGYPRVFTEGSQSQDLPENELANGQYKISITDVLCGSCKHLLFRPAALNCGHVFCKRCIPDSVPEKFECPVCQIPHPGGSPKVCLALDNFLEQEFPSDYALRKSTAQPFEISPINESPKTGTGEADDDTKNPAWWTDPLKTHFGVGCDYCGMYPIVGDRYQCQDCEEVIGFDLCGDCYTSRCKLPGRFNQQHKAEHKFKFIKPNIMQRWMTRFLTGRPPVDISADVLSGELENVVVSHAPGDTQDDDEDDDEDYYNSTLPGDDEEDEPDESPSV